MSGCRNRTADEKAHDTKSVSWLPAATVQDYDKMGRTADYWQCSPYDVCGTGTMWQMTYAYDFAGDVQNYLHPEGGFTITNTISAAQRITAITSSWVDSNHPQTLANNITYAPHGAVATLTNGCTGTGCTPALETYTYNNRLRLSEIQLGVSSSNPAAYFSMAYNYYLPGSAPTGCPVTPSGTGNNGNVIGYTYTDSVNNYGHNAAYVYDTLNRLICAQATTNNNNTNANYDLVFSYDRYGNMWCSTNGSTNGPCPNWSFNSHNQISGFGYDNAGDVTSDGVSTYTWDGEQRLSSLTTNGTTTTMASNAFDQRAYRTNGARTNWWDPQGQFLGGYWGYGWNAYLPLGGRLLAMYAEDSKTYFDHPDVLGSELQWTTAAGTTGQEMIFYPWGQSPWLDSITGPLYTTFDSLLLHDPNSTSSYYDGYQTPTRYYIPAHGRWLTPDSVRGDPTNPQSLDLYNYVTDNPTTLTDPSGLCGCGGGSGLFGGGEGGGGGCGGGGFGPGGLGGHHRGPPPPPPEIPVPGPETWSIVGGGLFSNPFSFTQTQQTTPEEDLVYAMPLGPAASAAGTCTACSAPFAMGGKIPGTGNLCEDPEPYLIRSFQCTGGQGTNKPGGCCYIEQGKFQASCQAHGGHMVTPSSATYSYAVCCSKTRPQNPAPGQPFPPPWYPPAC
jgi:RHS repeat-associated protein